MLGSPRLSHYPATNSTNEISRQPTKPAMSLVSGLKALIYTTTVPAPTTTELIDSLTAVLPILLAVAQLAWVDLPDYEETESSKTTIKRQFYQNFLVQAVTLLGALKTFDIDSSGGPGSQLDNALRKVNDALESSCASWTSTDGEKACVLAGAEHRADDPYPKLYAIARLHPDEGDVSDALARKIAPLIQLCSSKADKRGRILSAINVAFTVLQNVQSFDKETVYHCPVRFADYPFKHIRQHSATIFCAIDKCWSCHCDTSLHKIRAMKLNLTHHQHFETAPRYGCSFSQKQALFRIMFPTSLEIPDWQATDIAVRDVE